jgi:hypothetical protein
MACAPSQTTPKTAPTPSASAAPSPAAPASSQPTPPSLDPNASDPSKLLNDDYDSETEGLHDRPAQPGNSGLVVTVNESGPNEPWVVRIVNQGEVSADIIADTRLLWFEVKVPGQKKPGFCKLPEPVSPSEIEPRLRVQLDPGEGVVDVFDPRLYCFSEGDQKLLIPGATITPHFGWAKTPPKKQWKRGKLVEEPSLQKAPFVAQHEAQKPIAKEPTAEVSPATAPNLSKKPTKQLKSAKRDVKSEKLLAAEALAARSDKELIGNVFTLQSEYSVWSRRSDPSKPEGAAPEEPTLRLKLVQGSDARAEHNATVQITLENQSSTPTYVYFRREMLSFEVTGPRGVTLCAAAPDERSPEKRAFAKLGGHGKRTYASRLAELCPLGTFANPGLYLVNARFDATQHGEDQGLNAFVGAVLSDFPATVRIRVGDAPLLHKRMMPLGSHKDKATEEPHTDHSPALPGSPPVVTEIHGSGSTTTMTTVPSGVATTPAPTTPSAPATSEPLAPAPTPGSK